MRTEKNQSMHNDRIEDNFYWKCFKSLYRLIIMRSSQTFFISAITWHDIQQLSINLPEFTQFVQLMNWQNNSCKFVQKIAQWISNIITCNSIHWTHQNSFTIFSLFWRIRQSSVYNLFLVWNYYWPTLLLKLTVTMI